MEAVLERTQDTQTATQDAMITAATNGLADILADLGISDDDE